MTRFLPELLYTAAQSRELDRIAIEQHGLGGGELMERAGAVAYALLRHRWPRARHIVLVCGPGNNGGDGYVVARHALNDGLNAELLVLGDVLNQSDDAAAARRAYETAGGVVSPFDAQLLLTGNVIVDAIFGTGLQRQVSGDWADAIAAVNHAGIPVLSLDIPSGLHADTGRVLGTAVRASETISFIGLKTGLLTADGPDHCGRLGFQSLAVPNEVYRQVASAARRISSRQLAPCLPRRRRNSHKGDNGRILVIGGGPGMPGAARLAGEAALYTGAGLVTVATHPDHATTLNASRPELIAHGIAHAAQLAEKMAAADVLIVGPGLGQSPWAQDLMATVMESDLPKVIDADALNLVAAEPMSHPNWILTPHPGEAARLLRKSTAEIQYDRFAAVEQLVKQFDGVCVLKGAGTVVGAQEQRFVCSCGNPALATAGTGDLLSGAIGSFVAQGLNAIDAACAGVWVLGGAADAIAGSGERGWLAGDFLVAMRERVHQLEAGNKGD